jgi:hypothetical protein
MIVVGDLNFTVNAGEVWGEKARLDPLAGYFQRVFSKITI